MTREQQISVVIPTRNRATLLAATLESLTEQTLDRSRYEIVVVLDGPSDETEEVCRRFGARLDLRSFEIAPSGIAAAKNLGLFACKSPLVLFFDDDDVADGALLETHVSAHERRPDETVAVLGYTTWAPDLEVTPVMEHVTDIGQQLFSYPQIEDGQVLDFRYFWGGRSSCKRSLLVRHGAFDQRFTFGYEDIELAFRLSKKVGFHVVHERRAVSYMSRPVTFDEACRRSERQGETLWLFSRTHEDTAVQRYCRIHDALVTWVTRRETLDRDADRIRELERLVASAATCERARLLAELHELYGKVLAALRARGVLVARARDEGRREASVESDVVRTFAEEPGVPDRYRMLVAEVREAVRAALPSGSTVAVISKGDEELLRLNGHTAWHFPQAPDGGYAHQYPTDNAAAIRHLEEQRARGARYLVIPSTSLWWLDYYSDLARHLERRYTLVLEREGTCLIYALDDEGSGETRRCRAAAAAPRPSLVDAPIVVYGAPRSGTTYLGHLLNEHPEVFITNETRIFTWMHRALTEATGSLMASRDAFEGHLRTTLARVVRDFYDALVPPATRYWGDKNPHYARPSEAGCLETIADVFPGSRFIHIIRDGRDVVSSLMRKRHPDGRPWVENFDAAHNVWTGHVDIGRQFGANLPADRYFELRYEDLVGDDLAEATRLLDFLGLALHPRIAQFCRREGQERTPFSGPTRDLAESPISSDWEATLTPGERLRSLELLGERLVRYGYETKASLGEAMAAARSALDMARPAGEHQS